ncbi:MAG: hypothetical protein IJV39_01080 [Ruminococcus sp.]|nr:hypothetical protein [Ruminococcus sp.]
MINVKKFIKRHSKKLVVSALMACMSVMTCVSAFAAENDLSTSFSSAISTIKSDILGYIGVALPVALAIFGTIVAIKKGISFIRSLIGK